VFNKNLRVVFEEILPALSDAGVKYWVYGGVGIAGIVGRFIRENQDVDIYVLEEDFFKIETILKRLCEEHGSWDADGWDFRYSVLKINKRPKFDIFIKKIERFSVIPIYKIYNGVEFRTTETIRLSEKALIQELKSVCGFSFFSPPREVILDMFRSLIEKGIATQYNKFELSKEGSKYLIDARAALSENEINDYIKRFNKKKKT